MSTIDPTKFYTQEALEAELLKKAREEAARLWSESEKSRRLANLHQELGFRSTRDLISALQALAGGRAEGTPATSAKKGKRTRTTITDALRTQIKALAAEGKKAPTIAKMLGLSSPTVYKIIA